MYKYIKKGQIYIMSKITTSTLSRQELQGLIKDTLSYTKGRLDTLNNSSLNYTDTLTYYNQLLLWKAHSDTFDSQEWILYKDEGDKIVDVIAMPERIEPVINNNTYPTTVSTLSTIAFILLAVGALFGTLAGILWPAFRFTENWLYHYYRSSLNGTALYSFTFLFTAISLGCFVASITLLSINYVKAKRQMNIN